MLVIREIELRMPDSGAREAARQLQDEVPLQLQNVFRRARAFVRANPVSVVRGEPLLMTRATRGAAEVVAELETDASASAMKAYFFLAPAAAAATSRSSSRQVDAVLAAHPDDLSLKYRMLAFQPTYSAEAARDLIGQETGFGEVHLLTGRGCS